MNSSRPKPTVLLILDGFGCSDSATNNAIAQANTPVWDELWANCPHTTLACSGAAVGLPEGQMGNSEVGHLHLGAGRLLPQDFTRINNAIDDGSFFTNPALSAAVEQARRSGKAVHVLGLLSPGGVHSHDRHLQAMVEAAVRGGVENVFVHAFLDGRDMPPKSAAASIQAMEAKFAELGAGRFASLVGRYYAMDRDNRWDRVQKAYDLLTQGTAEFQAETPLQALEQAYARGESDEFVEPSWIQGKPGRPGAFQEGDVVVFMNFRSDRARELTRALSESEFSDFARAKVVQLGAFVTLTEYHSDFDFPVAFPPMEVSNCLGEVLAKRGLRQLRVAETEKYAHVTFFLNGGREEPFEGEQRILIPSPKVKTYDLKPEMSAPEVTDELVAAIEGGDFDAVICNYANGDMVGHTGMMEAAVKAIETLDQSLGRIVQALKQVGGALLITADHGNAEQMLDPQSGQSHTAHTVNPVPLVYMGRDGKLAVGGSLIDVAPTFLAVMGIDLPAEMTGHSLIE